MTPKLPQVLVLFSLISVTIQKKIPDFAVPSEDDLNNVVEHLKSHISNPSASSKNKEDSKSVTLLNIDTINLYVKDGELSLQADDEIGVHPTQPARQDRNCKAGRCGCGGGRCGREGDAPEDTNEAASAATAQKLLEELEREYENSALRCPGGYRCGRGCCGGRYRTEDGEENVLRCKYGRCGRGCCGRTGEREEDTLRCRKGRCRGRPHRSGDDYTLRCKYGRCGNGCCWRSGENNLRCDYARCTPVQFRSTNALAPHLESLGERYKLNKDFDAFVVDLSKYGGLFNKLTDNLVQNNQIGGLNQNREIDMDYIFGDDINENRNENELEGVVVDLTNGREEPDVISGIISSILRTANKKSEGDKDPIRPKDVVDFYLDQKQRLVGKAMNFVTNSRGNKDVTDLSDSQKQRLKKLRSEVQIHGSKTDEKELEKNVLDIILGEGSKSKVLPHKENSNNVYVPNWVYKAVRDSRKDLKNKKSFPMPNKQKLKLSHMGHWRRNAGKNLQDYGVPFQLQIQGLGQMNQ